MISLVVGVLLAQQSTYFARTFPVPTGNNGWEEYTMAADFVSGKGVRGIDRTLEQMRVMVAGCSRVYPLVQAGNSKPLTYPWIVDAVELDERSPDSVLADVGIAITYRIPVYSADGHPAAAADALIDALNFAARTSYPSLINTLRGNVTFAFCFRELAALLPKLDMASAQTLSRAFDRLVDGKQLYVVSYLHDIDVYSAFLPRWFDGPDREYWDVPEQFLSLTKDEEARYVTIIRAEFAKHKERVKAMVDREERFWSFEPQTSADPKVNYAFYYFFSATARSAVRVRTQFRLASIHCKIIEFKRTHNRWPEKLEDLGGREVWYDPASGGPFYYAKLTDQSYALYSLGTPETGRIDLVYRPQTSPLPLGLARPDKTIFRDPGETSSRE